MDGVRLTVQAWLDRNWEDAAEVRFHEPEKGHRGASTTSYFLDYFVDRACVDISRGDLVADSRALSVGMPVDLDSRRLPHWPAFLMDMLPQGTGRILVARAAGLNGIQPSAEIALLQLAASPVGNLRIKEAAYRVDRSFDFLDPRLRLSLADLVEKNERFYDVMARVPMLVPEAMGLQGEWPKLQLSRLENGDFYPDPCIPDGHVAERYVAKFVRSRDRRDEAILDIEYCYAEACGACGMAVPSGYVRAPGVLLVPRFDVTADGMRQGMESFVSAIGVAEFGHVAEHESYVDVLAQHATMPEKDVAEYVARDLLNLALGNDDNHGRNAALVKRPGLVELSPVFDLAPMRLSGGGVSRSTKWASMRNRGLDYRPDWRDIADSCASGRYGTAVMARLCEVVEALPEIRRRVTDATRFPEEAGHAMGRMDGVLAAASECLSGCGARTP